MANNPTRRDFLERFGIACAGSIMSMASPALPNAHISDHRQPNFVFIFCDDLGWADLPCYGHKSVTAHGGWTVRGELKMPNIDRMADEGTLFTQFYVNAAVCSPSRTAIMTGQYPARHGIHDYLASSKLNAERGMPDFVDPAVPTLTRFLKSAGYATGHFGKWHLGNGDSYPPPDDYGIDSYHGCLDGPKKRVGSTGMITDKTIDFIRENKDHPFYINVWLYDPHSPLRPTEEMMAPYDNLSPRWGDHKGALQVWYAVLSDIDHHTGRIVTALDELGLGGDTYVIFSSDNGPESGLIPFISHYGGASSTNTGPFRGIKRSLYEGGIREPFIVRRPGTVPAGKVNDTTVISGVDLLPTFCSLAGASLPGDTDFDGEDLSPALNGSAMARTKTLMWENRFPVYGHVIHKSPMLAVREGKWKLLLNPDMSRVELFEIPADPTELNNCAGSHPEVVERLSKQVLAWQKTLPDGPVDPDAGSNAYPWPGRD